VLEEQKSVIESAKKDEQIAKVRAETAYQDRTNFLLQASHDLRQPMQAIKYFVSTLKDKSPEPGVLEIVHKLQRAVRSMDELYNGLHDFNRIDADAIKADKVVCFLPLIIEEEVNNCMALAVEKGLALRVRIVHHAWIETDPHLVRRILRNILSNALIYTQQGGVLVALRKRGRMAHVQVFDTGEGIANHDLLAIFQPFVRMHPDRNHARRGLGLGLAIAEGLADKVGTRINVQSRPGRGSVFGFDLPMIHREVISLAAAFPFPDLVENSDRVPGGSMRHVALVDDDPEILEGCAALLTSAGYRVVSGRGGEELLASIRQSGAQPEILLSDIDLDTEEDAWQVHHQLQQHLGRTLPLMLITGSVTTASRERAERAAQTILQKPCDPEVLLHALDAALRTAT
jgi:CheY-like chemotaxis protein